MLLLALGNLRLDAELQQQLLHLAQKRETVRAQGYMGMGVLADRGRAQVAAEPAEERGRGLTVELEGCIAEELRLVPTIDYGEPIEQRHHLCAVGLLVPRRGSGSLGH